jgi:guanylate kinase
MFYDKEIEIRNISNGYKDTNRIYHEGKLEKSKSLMVDIQPYSAERLKKDYGYEMDVTKRIFCEIDSSIKINTVIKYNNYSMEVKKIIEWDDYMEIFCLEKI